MSHHGGENDTYPSLKQCELSKGLLFSSSVQVNRGCIAFKAPETEKVK